MSDKQSTEEGFVNNSFLNLITKHRNGVVLAKASEKLDEAVEIARDRQQAATVTVTIKLKPQNDDQMVVVGTVTSTLPKETLPAGMMYVDDDNSLHMSDPRQKELNLREVSKPASALKEASSKEVKEA